LHDVLIRRVQFLDLDSLSALCAAQPENGGLSLEKIRDWFGPVALLNHFPNRYQHLFEVFVAQVEGKVVGMIQVAPVNVTHTTWRIERLVVHPTFAEPHPISLLLLGTVFEYYRSSRTWVLESDIHDKDALAVFREKGFQSLAEQSYWQLNPEILAQQEPTTAIQLRPVSNADAALLCELDTATMPPIVRNVYNRHIDDFRSNFLQRAGDAIGLQLAHQERVFSYVYEPQRRVAIGAFDLYLQQLPRPLAEPHRVNLWVHPAYTWLYAPLMQTLAQILRHYPQRALEIVSADYQPEREAYFASLGAEVTRRTLLMSRSVWHKVRESRNPLEHLLIPEMLPQWQPLRNPLPNRLQQQKPEPPQPPQGF